MTKIKKSVVLVACVVAISIFVYYRQVMKIFQPVAKVEEAEPAVVEAPTPVAKKISLEVPAGSKAVSTVANYPVPGDNVDMVKFTLVVDKAGVISQVVMVDAKTEEADEHQVAFMDGLSTMIKGKKLSELKAVDRVGKSSLTTNAFNDSLDELKAAL
ncbi:MAG: hypothetical protein ABI747_01230 [Candidatus Moraniibacteriota bacterium]